MAGTYLPEAPGEREREREERIAGGIVSVLRRAEGRQRRQS